MGERDWIKAIGKKLREDLGDCPTLPQEPITAEELFSKGLELAVKSRDYKKALPYLEETVRKNPRHAAGESPFS